jgi:hypothetical protein
LLGMYSLDDTVERRVPGIAAAAAARRTLANCVRSYRLHAVATLRRIGF